MIVKLSLLGFSLLAVVNFFWLNNDTVNFSLLLTSGILINIHSIVSTVRIIRKGGETITTIDSAWFQCIVAGCFVLLLCQIFDYLYGKNVKLDFLSTIGTSCMSFFSTFLLYVTSFMYQLRNELSNDNVEAAEINDEATVTSTTVNASATITTTTSTAMKRQQHVVFVEGTSGLRKPYVCQQTYDLPKYLTMFHGFIDKHRLPYVQSMYETLLHTDLIGQLYDKRNDQENDVIACDRCIISQFAYTLLFHFDGAREDPLRFARAVDEAVFNDHGFRDMIAFVYGHWFELIGRVSGDRNVHVEWLIAKDITTAGILAAHSLKIVQPDWNLSYYIANQNHIFGRLKTIIGYGQLRSMHTRLLARTTTTRL